MQCQSDWSRFFWIDFNNECIVTENDRLQIWTCFEYALKIMLHRTHWINSNKYDTYNLSVSCRKLRSRLAAKSASSALEMECIGLCNNRLKMWCFFKWSLFVAGSFHDANQEYNKNSWINGQAYRIYTVVYESVLKMYTRCTFFSDFMHQL